MLGVSVWYRDYGSSPLSDEEKCTSARIAARRLAELGGSEPGLKPVPRRRPDDGASDKNDATEEPSS